MDLKHREAIICMPFMSFIQLLYLNKYNYRSYYAKAHSIHIMPLGRQMIFRRINHTTIAGFVAPHTCMYFNL